MLALGSVFWAFARSLGLWDGALKMEFVSLKIKSTEDSLHSFCQVMIQQEDGSGKSGSAPISEPKSAGSFIVGQHLCEK